MAKTISELLVRLSVNADTSQAQRFDRAMGTVRKTMIAAGAAATALGAGLFALTKQVAQVGDDAQKTAERIGTTAEVVQELNFVADLAGISQNDMVNGFRRLTRTVTDAERGLATATDVFDQLGLAINDNNGQLKPSVQLFEETIEKIAGMESGVRRLGISQQVFGRSGAQMLTLLDDGQSTMAEMRAEARSLGFIMSTEAAEASEAFNDSLVRLGRVVGGFKTRLAVSLMPAFVRVAESLQNWTMRNQDLIDNGLERFVDVIGTMAEKGGELIDTMGGLDTVLSTIGATLSTLAGLKLLTMLPSLISGLTSLLGLINPITLAIGVLVLIVQDVITYMRGGESVTGDLIAKLESMGVSVDDIVNRVKEFGENAVDTIKELWSKVKPFAMQAWELGKSLGGALLSALQLIGILFAKTIAHVWGRLKAAWSLIAPVVRIIVPYVMGILRGVMGVFTVVFRNIQSIIEFFIALFTGKFDSFGEAAGAAWKLIKDVAKSSFDALWTFITGWLDLLGEAWGKIFSGLGSVVTDVFDGMKDTVARVVDWIMDKINGMLDAVGKAGDFIAKFNPFSGGDDVMQNGVRENAAGRMGAGSGGAAVNSGDTTITVNAQTGADPEQIGRAVASAQRNENGRWLRQVQAALAGGEA